MSNTMGFMNALDVDAQELAHAVDKANEATIEFFCRAPRGTTGEEVGQFYRSELMNTLVAQGWVPPTLAELADRRVRSVINGEAPSIMDALVGASQLLVKAEELPLLEGVLV